MRAIVLAGGLGTRLRSALAGVPKAMAPIGGTPFLEILLDYLMGQGIEHVVLSLGHGARQIQRHFGSRRGSLRITCTVETSPLGTGGAIRSALAEFGDDGPVFVLNGDTFVELEYAALLRHHNHAVASAAGNLMSIVLREVPSAPRFGTALVDAGRVVDFQAAGTQGAALINAGVYVMRPTFTWGPDLGETFSFEHDLLEPQVARIRPLAWNARGFFIDIGIPEDLERARIALPAFLAERTSDE